MKSSQNIWKMKAIANAAEKILKNEKIKKLRIKYENHHSIVEDHLIFRFATFFCLFKKSIVAILVITIWIT